MLIPSWRFFQSVEPSPRVQWRVLQTAPSPEPSAEAGWRDFDVRPARVAFSTMVRRLFWNPQGNANLFMVSLAERLDAAPSPRISDLFFRRLAAEVGAEHPSGDLLQYRLIFLHRKGRDILREIRHLSVPRPFPAAPP